MADHRGAQRAASALLTSMDPARTVRRISMPHRERYLFICTNRREEGNPKGSCAQKGSEELVKALKDGFKKRGAADRIRACASGCLDLCEVGAAIVQEPDHVAYGGVRLSDVDEIVDAVIAGEIVDHLVKFRSRDEQGD